MSFSYLFWSRLCHTQGMAGLKPLIWVWTWVIRWGLSVSFFSSQNVLSAVSGLSVLRWVCKNWQNCRGCTRWCRSQPTGSAVVAAIYKYTWTTEILWRKRDSAATLSRGERLWAPRPLPQEERALTLALTSFYCFSRPLTSKMVLLYYAKFCFGWLSFADKGECVAEYIKEGYLQCKRRNGPNGPGPHLEGLAQILRR